MKYSKNSSYYDLNSGNPGDNYTGPSSSRQRIWGMRILPGDAGGPSPPHPRFIELGA